MGIINKESGDKKGKKIFKNFLSGVSPKMGFALGLIAGIAIFSTLSFFLLYGVFLKTVRMQNLAYLMGTQQAEEQADAESAAEEPAPTPEPEPEPAAGLSKLEPISGDEYVAGNEDATTSLILFTDFQCPYCSGHADNISQLIDEYGDRIKLVLRHFPLSFHPEARPAAEAAECAGEQGRFWEMHDEIFAMNAAGTMGAEGYVSAAQELGLNIDKFTGCMNEGKYDGKIQSDYEQGIAVGVRGTPATFIDGNLVSGAVPYEQFKAMVESVL